MKNKKWLIVLATLLVVSGGVCADVALTIDDTDTWSGYVNTYRIVDDSFAFPFEYPNLPDHPATLSGNMITLGANSAIYEAQGGGTAGEDPAWFTGDGSGTFILYIDMLTFINRTGIANGETVTFDGSVVSDTLSGLGYANGGYDVQLFMKTFDKDYNLQDETYTDLSVGDFSLSIMTLTDDAVVQAGFSVKGLAVDPTTAAGLGSIEVIPEPATMGLVGLAGGVIMLLRRQSGV